MEKDIIQETVGHVRRITDYLRVNLDSLFMVGQVMSPEERLARAEHLLAVSSAVLSLENPLAHLREILEKTEERRARFVRAIERGFPITTESQRRTVLSVK